MPADLWRTDGHPWIGQKVRRLVYASKCCARECIDGTIIRWLPPSGGGELGGEVDEPALWHAEHDDGDEEDLEEHEAREAVLAFANGLWTCGTYADRISEYVACGVRHVDTDRATGKWSVRVVHEALPPGETAASYFGARDVYVGNMYGHAGSMYLASSHARHFTTSCRDPYVAVLPRREAPHHELRISGWKNSPRVVDVGWPVQHPSAASILANGKVSGGMVRAQSVMFAALLWPSWYEFVPPREDDWNYKKIVDQNDGVVTHMLGEAVMPAMAKAIVTCAAAACGAASPITRLVDLFCCGGGFSLGAAEALPGLTRLDGVDADAIVLRNYAHNLPRALRSMHASVATHEREAPKSLGALRTLVGRRLGPGTHVHASPPCQGFVNGTAPDLHPYLELLLEAARAGCTCSFEEHRHAAAPVLHWLRTRTRDERARFFVYQVTARDYGSPTGRERCVVTSFPLVGEENLNVEVVEEAKT